MLRPGFSRGREISVVIQFVFRTAGAIHDTVGDRRLRPIGTDVQREVALVGGKVALHTRAGQP